MAVQVPLQNGRGFATIDGADLGLVEQFKWWIKQCGNTAYAQTVLTRHGKRYATTLHRLVMGLEPKEPSIVDHINGDGLDNRRGNLRIVTPAGNAQNARRQKAPMSGFRGVDRVGNRWRASIMADRVLHRLGYFPTAESAAAAYNAAAIELHGQHAQLNCLAAMAKGQGA